jgi:hypothetical protein
MTRESECTEPADSLNNTLKERRNALDPPDAPAT